MGKLQDYRSVYEQEKGRLQEDKLNRDSFLSYFHDLAMDEVESLFEVREYLVDSCGVVDIYKDLGMLRIRMRQHFKDNFEFLINPNLLPPSDKINTYFKRYVNYLAYYIRCYAKKQGNSVIYSSERLSFESREGSVRIDNTGKINHDEQESTMINRVIRLMQAIFASSNWILENDNLVLRIPYTIIYLSGDRIPALEVYGLGNDGLQKIDFNLPDQNNEKDLPIIRYQEVLGALLIDLGLELDFIDFLDEEKGMIEIKLPLSKLEDILNSDFMKATLTDEQKRVLTRW